MWEWNVKCTIQGVAEGGFVMCMCIYTFGKDSVFFPFLFFQVQYELTYCSYLEPAGVNSDS